MISNMLQSSKHSCSCSTIVELEQMIKWLLNIGPLFSVNTSPCQVSRLSGVPAQPILENSGKLIKKSFTEFQFCDSHRSLGNSSNFFRNFNFTIMRLIYGIFVHNNFMSTYSVYIKYRVSGQTDCWKTHPSLIRGLDAQTEQVLTKFA